MIHEAEERHLRRIFRTQLLIVVQVNDQAVTLRPGIGIGAGLQPKDNSKDPWFGVDYRPKVKQGTAMTDPNKRPAPSYYGSKSTWKKHSVNFASAKSKFTARSGPSNSDFENPRRSARFTLHRIIDFHYLVRIRKIAEAT